MSSKIYSAQVVGLKADLIDIEVDVSRGLKSYAIVGLPDSAVKEAKDRISAALKNSGFISAQKGNKKVIVSLAPADLKKEGPVFDLGIALAHLIALGDISFDPSKKLFLGELSLAGELRPIKGALLIAQKARAAGFEDLFLPKENVVEAALVSGIRIHGARTLREIIDHFHPEGSPLPVEQETELSYGETPSSLDFCDIKGQESAKRGLEIAAAGGHNIAMSGPPGTGKTMLAKAFIGILPPLDREEVLETTGIHSVTGTLETDYMTHPPLRSPHHTASYVSVVGGGAWPKPGEITLAHRGVLFLDEFPEFDRRVIEALRQPLEDRIVSVSRAKGSVRFPANFILIATLNPCPCGNRSSREKPCVCTAPALARYERKLSGPIIDRIDLWLDVPAVDHRKLSDTKTKSEDSASVAKRVAAARAIQKKRFIKEKGIKTNSDMGVRELKTHAPLGEKESALLNAAASRLGLSARAYHRVIKLARTIADLDDAPIIKERHLLEALQYRPKSL